MRNLSKYGITATDRAIKKAAGLIWCSGHKDFVEAEEMSGRKAGYCRRCQNAYHDTHEEIRRRSHLRRNFKTTPEWYAKQNAAQRGLCAICRKPNGKRRLAVDHNHWTDKLRGLLCTACNVALERLDNIPGWADLAKAYLEKFDVR